MVKFLRALVCALLTVVALVAAAPGASAAPPTAAYSGSAEGDVAAVDLNLLAGAAFTDARLANSEATTTNPPAAAVSTSRNLAATVVGFGATVGTNELSGPPSAGPLTRSLVAASALGISSGAITSINEVDVAGAGNCATDEPAAQTTTTTAGLDVSPTGVVVGNVLTTTASSVTTATGLVSTGGLGFNRGVVSEAVGTLGDVSLFDGAVDIEVVGDATLTASANGTTDGADIDYEAPVVTVTFGGVATELEIDAVESTNVDLGALGNVTVTLNEPTAVVEDPAGLNASASVSVITLDIELGVAGALGTVTVDLLPLTVSATVPAGGIDCPPPAPEVVTPADGDVINDSTPTYTGTGVPGAIITLTVDGTVIADDIEVDEDGEFTFPSTVALSDDDHTVSAIQTLNGTPSEASAVNAFVVDTDAPDAPVITAPDDGSTTDDPTPTITGTGEPGATVAVEIDGDEVDTVTVDGGGNWTLPLDEPLDDGEYTVTATQTDEAGNTSGADEVTFVVDTGADPPVINAPADGSSTNDTTPTIRGTAEPGASVDVGIDGDLVGTVTADSAGNWTLTLTEPLAEGDHTVSAVQTDGAGNVSEAAENEFTVDVTDPATPVITDPDDGDTVDDRTPTIEGTGEPGTTIVVVVDGEQVGSVVVDEDGTWSFTLPDALADGDHVIEVFAVDEAGNESGVDGVRITVDGADGSDGPQLADTGGPSLGYAVVGGALLVVGGTVLTLSRRRA